MTHRYTFLSVVSNRYFAARLCTALTECFIKRDITEMKRNQFIKFLFIACAFLLSSIAATAQAPNNAQIKSREVSDGDGIPVLTKHLPDWETARDGSAYILNAGDLRRALGEKKVFDAIDFAGGTEAVSAVYPQGRLLIVEFYTPQASIEADGKIQQELAAQNAGTAYRRIGNYSAFVFDAADETAANALLDQIKYEKTVQWLGSDPFALKRAERNFIEGTANLFLSTVTAIVGGLGLSILAGLLVGFVYFRVRQQRRSQMAAFSDAGGMTRLNLDGLSAQTSADRLLEE